jgi:hypothetical protein
LVKFGNAFDCPYVAEKARPMWDPVLMACSAEVVLGVVPPTATPA